MNLAFRHTAGLVIGLAFAFGALAQKDNGPVQSRLEQAKVVRAADGKESLAPAEATRPGDVVEYTATYRNAGDKAVRNLEATLPIPAETELVGGSERPAGARASIDGKTFGTLPLKRKKLVQGRELEEAVPMREVRYLRWSVGELPAGQSTVFSARVKLLEDRPPPAGGGGRK